MKLEREERNGKFALEILREVGGGVHLFVSNPIGLWLAGKLFLKGVVDPLKIGDEATRIGINEGFDALAALNAAVNITGQALPLITALGALRSAGPTLAAV